MRPTREAFEALMVEYGHTFGPGFGPELMRPSAKAALLDVYEAQEAQIRELTDALECMLRLSDRQYLTCECWEDSSGEVVSCPIHLARKVLARTRGAS